MRKLAPHLLSRTSFHLNPNLPSRKDKHNTKSPLPSRIIVSSIPLDLIIAAVLGASVKTKSEHPILCDSLPDVVEKTQTGNFASPFSLSSKGLSLQ
jgi:hypothetical protein